MTSWASVLEHVTSGFAMEKSTKICEKKLCKNARIPALGYGALEGEEECPNGNVENGSVIGILSNSLSFYHLELQSPVTDSSCITPTFMGQP